MFQLVTVPGVIFHWSDAEPCVMYTLKQTQLMLWQFMYFYVFS